MDQTSQASYLSIIVLAKDEEATIQACLKGILSQDLFEQPEVSAEVLVIANGCTDRTAEAAHDFVKNTTLPSRVSFIIDDFATPGKSRSWNRAVHELTTPKSDFLMFIDSDVTIINRLILSKMMKTIKNEKSLCVYVGYPVKDLILKKRKSIIDRISLKISKNTRYVNAINGSLYVAKARTIRSIWLPDETPGEDGFLNAMIRTNGFTLDDEKAVVRQATAPTHYFSSSTTYQFFSHERRMVVGTMINRWCFEYLWSLKLEEPAGPLIADWNKHDPHWMQRLIDAKTRSRRWVIPIDMILRRFSKPSQIGWPAFLRRLPLAAAATLLSLPSIIAANSMLKRKEAARAW